MTTVIILALYLALGIEILNVAMKTAYFNRHQFNQLVTDSEAGRSITRTAQFLVIVTWPVPVALALANKAIEVGRAA